MIPAAPPPSLEGQSFVPLLNNPQRRWKPAAFAQVTGAEGIAGHAVRTERHRYIRWTGPFPGEELYDEHADPREFHNLAADPANRGLKARLSETLDKGWRSAKANLSG